MEIIDYLKNPALLRQKGVSRIGGVLLAGAPGTGKTLLAKSIAAESGVRMFTCSGTDFFDVSLSLSLDEGPPRSVGEGNGQVPLLSHRYVCGVSSVPF